MKTLLPEYNAKVVWSAPEIVSNYVGRDYITPQEVAALCRVAPALPGATVLDVGVGAGRTIPFLLPLCGSYTAIDFAADMVAACRRRFPAVDVRQGDARDLADFTDGSVDVLLFSFNGIDCIHPDERALALRAAHRVLRPGGYFVFSAHNLRAVQGSGWSGVQLPDTDVTRHPLRAGKELLHNCWSGLVGLRNYLATRDQQIFRDDLVYINDGAHNHTLLNCYIEPAAQERQLTDEGFRLEATIGRDGAPAGPGCTDTWIYYVARRTAGRTSETRC
jgi:SAM-dependent methyltransferase